MISLYKEGNSHIVRGVICELRQFKPDEIDYALSLGYVTSPDSIGIEEAKELTTKELRLKAKEAGITNYSKKKAVDLKEELGL